MSNSNIVISNFFWRLAERSGAQIVSLVVSIVLARILAPEVFGMLALVMVFTNILQVFVDSGLATALIQKKDADELDFSSVFFFNLVMCLILYLIIFVLAPYIADFYDMPELTSVVRVLCLIIVISGVKNIQQAYVSRNLIFKRFFYSTLGGTIGAAVLGVFMAYKGYGVWALVAQYLFNTTVGTLILWITVKWRPSFVFSWSRLKALLSFGYKLLGVSILSTGYRELRSILIGKLYAPSELAFYNRGQQFPQLIALNIDSAIDSVLLPTMSQKQGNPDIIKNMARLSIRTGTYVLMPLMIGLAACAAPIVEIILTDKWLPCVPFMQLLCFSNCFFSVFTANYNISKSLGRSDIYLKTTIWTSAIGIIVLLATMWLGVFWIAVGVTIASIISLPICVYPSKKLCGYTFREQLADIMPNLSISLLTGLCMYPLTLVDKMPTSLILACQLFIGAIIFIGLSMITQNRSYIYLRDRYLMMKTTSK